jgi:phenylacetate-CoA ligase
MQIVQDVPGKIRVKVVKDDNFSDRDIETLSRELRARLGEDMELEYEFVQDIPLTERGKFRAVVSNLKIEEFL